MIKELMHDPIFLAQKSETADRNDIQTANDLRDTLEANRERCVGMAANMIGVKKRIICFVSDGEYMIMFNPEIIKTLTTLRRAAFRCLAAPENAKGTRK